MRPALRAFAIAASLVLIVGYGCPAFSAAAQSPAGETNVRHWDDWWMHEVLQQSLPTPQLLYFDNYQGRHQKSDFKIGDISASEEFKILYIYPVSFPENHYWHRYEPNTDWLNTEAFVMPSPAGVQSHPSCYESRQMAQPVQLSYARLQLYLPWKNPAVDENLPEEYAGTFSWLKDIRAPATIRFSTFSKAEFEDRNPFRLHIPKRLSEYGDDLGLFEYSLRVLRIDLFSGPGFFGNR